MNRLKRSLVVFSVASLLLAGGAIAIHPRARLHCYWWQHHCTPTTTTTPPPTRPTTTTSSTTTTSVSTTTNPKPTTTTSVPTQGCVGVSMLNGQTDINNNPNGTTFCISGIHNWSLVPKTGDKFFGGVLDGQNTTQWAFQGSAANVVLSGMEVRNYRAANQQGAIAAVGPGWTLEALQVHDNGTTAGGGGSTGGHAWTFLGGRYYNNRQEGIAGGVNGGGEAQNTTLDGVELDHNNFADDTYTKANVNCDNEAGGFKWVGSGNTIKNSSVHDNACRGLWADIDAKNSTVTNNHVYNNWADGIMIEISSGATITNNIVTGNGFKEFNGGAGSCRWMYGAGIFISTSSHVEVANNTLSGNCSGITGGQENRGAQHPVLEYLNVHDNSISGPGKNGAAAADGTNLATKNITFVNNTLTNGATYCGLTCS